MMKKLLLLTLISVFVLGVADNLMAQKPIKKKKIEPALVTPEPPKPENIFIPIVPIIDPYDWKIGNPHTATWRLIDSLIKKGDKKVPSRMVDSLYKLSLSNRDPIQIVKAVTYQQKFIMQADKSGFAKALRTLEKQIDEVPFIAKQILLLLLAERYEMVYYGYGLDLFYEIKDTPEDSLQRKGLKEASEISNLYDEALNDEHNKDIPMDILKDLFEDTKLPDYLQGATLYDYLAWQKLNYLQDDRVYWSVANYDMGIEDEMAFASAEAFVAYSFDSNKPNTFYKAIAFYQDLTKQYLEQSNQLMRQDLDLRRIGFVYGYAKMENREALYQAAIKREMNRLEQDSVYAEWAYLLANYHYDLGSLYDNEHKKGPNRFEWRTAYNIVETAIKKYPKSRGGLHCQNLKAVIKTVNLDITTEEVYPLDKPMLVHLSYRNTPKVYCRLLHAAEAQSTIITDRYYESYYLTSDSMRQVLNKALFSLSNVESWSLNLASDKDCRQHDTEIKINAQTKAGLYVLAVSLDSMFQESSFIQYASFSLSNLAYNYCDNNANLNLQVYDRSSGKPLSGVEVTLYEDDAFRNVTLGDKDVILNRLRSNSKGLLSTRIGHDDFELRLSKEKDYLNLYKQDNDIYSYEKDAGMYQTILFFLDRTIYRPGQTLYFKGLAIKQDVFGHRSKVLPGTKHKITLYNDSYQQVATQWFKANEYGTFNGEFKLPASGRLGEMSLREGDGYYNSSISFKVEEYKRPKFDVSCEVLKEQHLVNQAVKVKGKAMAFAGSSIDGAKVSYTVSRRVESSYWYDGYGNKHYNNVTILSRETTSSADGSFEFDFIASPDSSIERKMLPRFIYTIKVDVTDIAGETHSSQCQVTVAYHSFVLDLDIKNNQDINDLKTAKISTRNLNGEPIFAQGTVFIEELESPKRIFKERLWKAEILDQVTMNEAEFKANFPTVLYGNEDKLDNWKVKRVLANTSFDTKQSDVLKLDANQVITAGIYRITLMSKDSDGDTIKVVKYTRCYDLENKTMPAGVPLIVKTDKSTYEPGEKAIVYIGSSFKHCYVNYTIEHESRIVEKGQIDIHGIAELSIPILEKYRGNIIIHVLMVKDSRVYKINEVINVPFSNKELKIEYTSFRDKLAPGQEEEWRLKILGPKGDKLSSELLASLYDASLDKLVNHSWESKFFRNTKAASHWSELLNNYGISKSYGLQAFNSVRLGVNSRAYPSLNWYDLLSVFRARYSLMYADDESFLGASRTYYNRRNQGGYGLYLSAEQIAKRGTRDLSTVGLSGAKISLEDESRGMASSGLSLGDMAIMNLNMKETSPDIIGFDEVKIRTNLDETVFFMPELRTDAEGNVVIKFKMNEALTRWKLMLLAHTKDLETAYAERYIVTQKPLMIVPNAPRFLRVNDEIVFTAKVNNLSATALTGEAKLELYDALTMQPIDSLLRNMQAILPFTVAQGQSAILQWPLKIPSTIGAVTYRVIAKSDNFSDGEENTLPVVTNQILVTEATPLPIRGGEHRTFELKHFEEIFQSKTMRPHKLTLEFTSNPSWYAIQSLTYLMEYPHECTEQLFSRYYANSIAAYVMNKHPKIKQVFETWKSEQSNALISNWEKNPELKLALIEETPWVLEAKNDTERKRNISLLFDFSRMSNELDNALDKMAKHQNGNGAFGWFSNQYINDYMTQYVIEGFGHLNQLGVNVFGDNSRANTIVRQAIAYCDNRFLATYNDSSSRKPFNPTVLGYNIDWVSIHYLYVRSFYLNATEGHLYVPIESDLKKAYDYYMKQVARFGHLEGSLYARGLMALAAYRYGEVDVAKTLVKSIRDIATINDDFGMHWNSKYGYYWYNMNIETHALLLEMFNEVTHDSVAIEGIKMYLLRAKQVLAWETTKATTAATYALLLTGDDWLEEDENLKITVGNTVVDQSKLEKEVGTGYFKTSWNTTAVKPEMSNISIENPNKHVAWGAIYWQYFEDLEKVKTFKETPLRLEKRLSHLVKNQNGSHYEPVTDTTVLHIGELINVELELNVEHPMEYIHLKDMRAACFEPTSVLSETKYQNWITYYESTRDLSTNFFIDYLIEGKYIFTYSLYVTHSGNFSNGIGMAQSMYAPEFTSHSAGMRIQVK